MEWDCPSWGCHGALFVEGDPKDGEHVWCRRWPGTHASVCGRRMRWDRARASWFLVRDEEFDKEYSLAES